MAHTTTNNTMVRVIETQAVDYEKHSWLIFEWNVKVNTTKLRNDIFIVTNDEFDSVFINNVEYEPRKVEKKKI
jgi:hypothetical protein